MTIEGEVLPPEDELDASGFNAASRPLCPFCSKPWGDAMVDRFAECSLEFGYYDDVERVDLTIDITCDGCERLIYRKEMAIVYFANPTWP